MRQVGLNVIRDEVELKWANKGLRLVTGNDRAYEWVDSDDPRVHRVSPLQFLASYGDRADLEKNLLIQGDASHALRSLRDAPSHRDEYVGKVKLCYIDPPFNTGETFRYYNDAMARSEWLTMTRDVLVNVRELLSPDGSIWVHVDDSEQHHVRCLLDEVFGPRSFVATVIWQKRTTRENRTSFSSMHDYIHVYAPAGPIEWKRVRNPLPDKGAYVNPDDDPRGPWRSVPMTAQAGHATRAQFYSLVSPTGVTHEPPPGRCWTYSRSRFVELLDEGRVYWPKAGAGKPRLKKYASEVLGVAPFTIWAAEDVGTTGSAKKELMRLLPGKQPFDTPKPERLLERIVHIATDPGDMVLDCFLGSGTTASVAHKMGRRWLAVERDDLVVSQMTIPRLRRMLRGDGAGVSEDLGWQGGGGFTVRKVDS
jgi:adenine-specific DNA-methyltransferase